MRLDDCVSRSSNVIFSDLDNELLIIVPDQGKVLSLNQTARSTWLMLDQPMSFGDICARLMVEYTVDAHSCHEQTEALIAQLAAMELFSVEERAASDA